MKCFAMITALLVMVIAPAAQAQVPQLISYQGALHDGSGNMVPDGPYDITFRMFLVPTGGAAVYTETQLGVPVSRGGFSVLIGSVVALTLPFSVPYWLEIQVAPDPAPLSPRIQLVSSPYAQMAETVLDDAITSAKIAAGAVQGLDILDNTVTAVDIAPNIVSSIDGVANDGGDIDIVAGARVTVTPDDLNNRITVAGVGPAYAVSGALNTTSFNVGSTWTKLQNFLTFTKAQASSVIEVMLHSRASSGTFSSALGVQYGLRVDDLVGTTEVVAAITTSNSIDFISCFAAFTGLAAGSHTVSIWARTGGGTSNGIVMDPGGWGGRIVVREL